MMRKNEKGIYTSSLLSGLGITHGYSTRQYGDLRGGENKEKYLQALGKRHQDLVIGEQVHGIRIARVGEPDLGKTLTGTDGLVSDNPQALLGVTFADCVPILAVDPKAYIIGVAHAGWKGTLAGIAQKLITAMKLAGADVHNIHISIGPHISMCHYNVLEDRIMAYRNKFGENPRITAEIESKWHLDIGYANYQLLLDSGVRKEHIDAPPTCTACQVGEFNSFRADPKDRFGVQLGVIAL